MLTELLPERVRKIPELMAVIQAEEPEAQAAYTATVDFLAQLNVDTATWGLALWEFAYGIPTQMARTLAERRSILKAKMRGAATTTIEQLRRIVNAYTNHDRCTVTEYPREYMVEVSYELSNYKKELVEACRASLREALPAHLGLIQTTRTPVEAAPLYISGTLVPYHQTTNLPPYLPEYAPMQANVNGALCSAVTIKLPPAEVN